jgi:hypothetical protein
VLGLLLTFAGGAAPMATPDVRVDVDLTQPDGVSWLSVGVTHMEYSLDAWGDPGSVQRGKALLADGVRVQNQHIFGFGAGNINPAPGVYDWSTLDSRLATIRSIGSIPVLTLCCAPDWMKGGRAGETNWSRIEAAPLPEHYSDFAELARQVALRYPDVHYYLVWNELKGFWNATARDWDYVGYTRLYNMVYDTLKSVNPDLKVGGPYFIIAGTGSERGGPSTAKAIIPRDLRALEYWLGQAHGADFIALDRGVRDYHDSTSYSPSELLALTPQYQRVAQQVQARTTLPLWWVEDGFTGSADWDLQAVGLASILYHELRGRER